MSLETTVITDSEMAVPGHTGCWKIHLSRSQNKSLPLHLTFPAFVGKEKVFEVQLQPQENRARLGHSTSPTRLEATTWWSPPTAVSALSRAEKTIKWLVGTAGCFC